MPCVKGIRLNRTLECLEILERLCSSEALGKFALAFPESSVSLWGIVFPRESESYFPGSRKQKGWTRKKDVCTPWIRYLLKDRSLYASTPPQTDTVVP